MTLFAPPLVIFLSILFYLLKVKCPNTEESQKHAPNYVPVFKDWNKCMVKHKRLWIKTDFIVKEFFIKSLLVNFTQFSPNSSNVGSYLTYSHARVSCFYFLPDLVYKNFNW